ncbi:hypothetical protein ACIBF1_21685 [Spirillospora sp. NPDC050679]
MRITRAALTLGAVLGAAALWAAPAHAQTDPDGLITAKQCDQGGGKVKDRELGLHPNVVISVDEPERWCEGGHWDGRLIRN